MNKPSRAQDRRSRFWLLAIPISVWAACAPYTTFTPLNDPPATLSARKPESIHVYSGTLPPSPFVEVGLLSTRTGELGGGADSASLVAELRTSAADKGCDAVINVHSTSAQGPYSTLPGLEGTCVAFLPSPAVRSADSAQPPR